RDHTQAAARMNLEEFLRYERPARPTWPHAARSHRDVPISRAGEHAVAQQAIRIGPASENAQLDTCDRIGVSHLPEERLLAIMFFAAGESERPHSVTR